MSLEWSHQHETYLKDLSILCETFGKAHSRAYVELKRKEKYFRIPSIIVGSVSGTLSVGTGIFPLGFQNKVSILVGGVSLGIAIIASIEAYLKITDRLLGHYSASKDFHKLRDDIHLELALAVDDRSANGLSFTRGCYERFEKIINTSPFLNQRRLHGCPTYIPSTTTSYDQTPNPSSLASQPTSPTRIHIGRTSP